MLEFDEVQLAFAGVKAIDGVSFTVGGNELFAIIGPNGAGKTSIFNVLSGVYRPQPAGSPSPALNLIGKPPARDRQAGHGPHVPEHRAVRQPDRARQPHARPPPPHRIRRAGRRSPGSAGPAARSSRNRAAVEEIIDFLELEQWRRFPVGLLPYGVQKRVELGRALAMEPKLLLLDEPVAGMNLEETEDMARFILDIRDELRHPDRSWSSTTWAW